MSDRTRPPLRMRFSFESRCRAVQLMLDGEPIAVAAARAGASRASGYRWWQRFRREGWAGLRVRRSTPHRQPRTHRRRPADRRRGAGTTRVHGRQGAAPARAVAPAATAKTTSPALRASAARRAVARRHRETRALLGGRETDPGRRSRPQPACRWQFAYVAVGDHSRLAYVELLPSERVADAVAFLERARRWYGDWDIDIEAVMTDNGSAYVSSAWRERCAALGLHHLRTRHCTPRTNGKAERFIQTLLRSWAYGCAYPTSVHRARALSGWLC